MKKTWIPFLRDVHYQKLEGALWCCGTFTGRGSVNKKQSNLAVSIKCINVLQYLMLRDSPCGGTSKFATVAVTTRGVPLLIWKIICSGTPRAVTATVAPFDVPPQGLSRNITTRLQVFGSERHIQNDYTFFSTKRWKCFFAIYIVRLALYVCLKNICDGVGGQDESNGTHLDPPLFGWTISLKRKFLSAYIHSFYVFREYYGKYLSVHWEYGKFRIVCRTQNRLRKYEERIYAYMEKTQRYTILKIFR